jgi:iron(III) transport system substrate-binding protein
VSGIAAPKEQIPIAQINPPNIDLSNLSDLEGTLELLQQAGLL